MGDLDPSVIKRTQQTLGKYVKKPPLTEKLLTKPPFRFLHDVFNAFIKETGCFVGLYSAEELNSENIKNRDDKMRFLQKMIDVINIVCNKTITVRTSKIVAGQEPDKTNELLQLMGEVIEKKLDWRNAVEQVLNGKSAENPQAHDKHAERRLKDKANEKSKDKENKAKDVKTKDIKKVGKTISPQMKSEKSAKRFTEDREKEKASKMVKSRPKDTKGKVVRKSEKSAENTNLVKNRVDSKVKGPSPDKSGVNKEPETGHLTNEPNVILKPDSMTESITIEMDPLKSLNEISSNENHRRSSKTLEQDLLVSQILMADHSTTKQDTTKQIIEAPNDVESRKSSALSKKSSGSSRRSSVNIISREEATKTMHDENDNINESKLKKMPNGTIHNDDLRQQEEPQLLEKALPPQQKPKPTQTQRPNTSIRPHSPIQSPAPPPTANPPTPAEVRREHTFTRENSRDSSTTSNIANRPRTSLRPPSARPASARPGAPRRRDRNIEIVLQPNDQVKLSGINVKLESFGDLDDDGENLVIIEDANTVNIGESEAEVTRVEETGIENNFEQQGHLVQQILETQKELMQQQSGTSTIGKNEKDVNFGNNAIGRQSSARQMNNLRDVIQNLTKSVSPFGKLMDFIPEDIDAMQLELTMWRDTYTQVANELRREKSLTESATEPMKNQLVQIEANIKEFMEMIDASRTKILQSSEKILKMFAEQ